MRLPDPRYSRAVLVGVSKFANLTALPAVANNLDGLASCLQDDGLWGLPTDHCRVISQPDSQEAVGKAVKYAAQLATDTLLVYYSGHGLADEWTSDLLLALPGTVEGEPYTAMLYDQVVRRAVLDSPARCRIVIIDCCFSGRILGTMADSTSVIAEHATISGTFVMTSARENSHALAPPGDTYTAFTGALIDLLENGQEGGPELLDLDTIYRHVRAEMISRSLPEPQVRQRNLAGDLPLVRNRAWRSTSSIVPRTASPVDGPPARAR